MRRTTTKKITGTIIILILILNMLIIPSSGKNISKKEIKIAIIKQRWDILDKNFDGWITTLLHKRCLRQYEDKYNVKFKVYEFWDDFDGGDVQNGLLEKLDIDVIIGPGGFGCLNTPEAYRKEIKKFVFLGGGFYGICGDSTFGSLGMTHTNKKLLRTINRVFEIEGISPMLKLANVYTDASVFEPLIDEPLWFKKTDLLKPLMKLPLSRTRIYFKKTNPPIQEPYFRSTIRTMMGNAPMIDGPLINRLFMSKVKTIAIYVKSDEPYNSRFTVKKAIIATTYGLGRVILSSPHPELTIGNKKAHDVYVRNVLWLARALPNT